MPKRRLLVIDDSITIRALIEQLFADKSNVEVVAVVASGEEAVEVVERLKPDVITLDIMLPGIDGFAVLDFVMANHPAVVIVISSSGAEGSDLCARAVSHGAAACFDKARIIQDVAKLRKTVVNAKKGRYANTAPN